MLVLLAALLLQLADPEAARAPLRHADPRLAAVRSFVYQLQNADLTALLKSKFDLIVMDYSADGSAAGRYGVNQIKKLRASGKIVVSYLSIGEAENYRFYWNPNWDRNNDGQPGATAPSFLGPQNPDWAGNYKVRYWDPAWQKIIFAYEDQIIDAGFDGVYLDIVDAFEYWGPDGESGLNRATAELEMVRFVEAITNHARVDRKRPNFIVVAQNAEQLVAHRTYVSAIDGIGKEDTWYNGNTPNDADYVDDVLSCLDAFKAAGRTVLTIDYVTKPRTIADFYRKALAKAYVPYATDRELDQMTINKGFEPK